KTQPAAHWIELFEGAGIPCGPIYNIDQVFADPQVKHLGLAAPVSHKRLGPTELVASPINMSGIPRGIRAAPPERGEHTEAVLRGLGYDDTEIAELRSKGAI
ncbi:MAG: CoA transferase, partial [Acetobacteraceae bacterium]|nr:CoA transferase [Acetobacteraceae bacterium]